MNEIITVLSSDVSILSSIAVSRLMPVWDTQVLSLSADQYKLLISEPCEDTSTKHISKYVSFSDMINVIREQFKIDTLSSNILELSNTKSDRRQYELSSGDRGGWLIANTLRNPYIISAIYETNNGNISGLSGYNLSVGMNEAFKYSTFDTIKALSINSKTLSSESISSSIIKTLSVTTNNLSSKTISSDTIRALSVVSDTISSSTLCCNTIHSTMLSTIISTILDHGLSTGFIGKNGDVVYASPDGSIQQSIVNNDIYICNNDTDLERCINADISFKDIYNSWIPGGRHYVKDENRTQWYGYTDYPNDNGVDNNGWGYKYWYYDDKLDTIVQPNNTADDTFFTSRNKYTSYDITIRCYSTNIDDDAIGFILAFIEKGPDGMPHFLAAVRSCNHQNPQFAQATKHWYVVHNSIFWDKNTSIELNNPSNEFIPTTEGWKTCGAGTLIRAKRTNNTIEVWTTPFSENVTRDDVVNSKLENKITIDLTKVANGIFSNQPASIGYTAYSQPYTMYENIDFNIQKTIVDTRTNSLSVYDPISKELKLTSTGAQTLQTCGYGRFIKNPLTGKVFYTSNTTFDPFIKYSDLQGYETRITQLEEEINKLKNVTILKVKI